MQGILSGASQTFTNFNPYPVYTNRILIQHGINLGIAGFYSAPLAIAAMAFNSEYAPFVALVPYLVDWGYFIAVDLPHLGTIVGEAQTYIISVGLICVALFRYNNSDQGEWETLQVNVFVGLGAALITAGIVNIIIKQIFGGWPSPILMDGTQKTW